MVKPENFYEECFSKCISILTDQTQEENSTLTSTEHELSGAEIPSHAHFILQQYANLPGSVVTTINRESGLSTSAEVYLSLVRGQR